MSECLPSYRFLGVFWFSLAAFQTSATTFTPNSVASLIAAMNAAVDGDVIDLGGALFVLNLSNYANDLTNGINGLPNVSVDLTIENGTIERDSSLSNSATDNEHFRLIHIAAGASLSLENVALVNGLAAAGNSDGLFGGAIYNLGSLNLDEVIFIENNAVNFGGAIYNAASTPLIDNSIFISNAAIGIASIGAITGVGGAIYNASGTIGDISATIFLSNRSGELSGTLGGGGGAIANVFGGTISRIIESIFVNNSSPGIRGRGGAILNYCSSLIGAIEGSVIIANSALHIGGAINIDNENNEISEQCPGTTAINLIADTIFSGNMVTGDPSDINAGFGGAIALAQLARIEEISCSTFADNAAEKGGGAIFNFANAIITEINSTTFSNNSTEIFGGGAIFTLFGASIGRISNSTLFGNVAGSSGGGGALFLVNNGVINEISNSTIYGNNSLNIGGGILSTDSAINNLVSTIVAGNTAISFPDINLVNSTISQASFNLIGTDVGHSIVNNVNNNLVGTLAAPLDALLGPLAFNGGNTQTLALLQHSPAIDAGTNPNNLAFDQRCGNSSVRTAGPETDIGAFECQDYDRDNVCDVNDNCPTTANPTQADSDHDGVGNACSRGASGGGISIYWAPPPVPEICPINEAAPDLGGALLDSVDCTLPRPVNPLQVSCSDPALSGSNKSFVNTERALSASEAKVPTFFQDTDPEEMAGCSTTTNSHALLCLFVLTYFQLRARRNQSTKQNLS